MATTQTESVSATESSSSALPRSAFLVNQRYLHSKTRHALTIRYIGPLPGAEDGHNWIGVEYDDPSCGKGHSGTYKGVQVFVTTQHGAGAFIKDSGSSTPLIRGPTLVVALEERYGPLDPQKTASMESNQAPVLDSVILGSSNASIVVEAPRMDGVRQRIGKLERLREIGFDGEWIVGLGGNDSDRALLAQRLKNVHTLDLTRNLLESWAELAEITTHLPGLTTLVLNHSRIRSPFDCTESQIGTLRRAFGAIAELHLGNAAYIWSEAVEVASLFPNLGVLYLNHNTLLHDLTSVAEDRVKRSLHSVKVLSLDGCPIRNWEEMAKCLSVLPNLECLNIAATPITSIPPCSSAGFQTLARMSLADTRITTWRDIDHLADWTSGKLQNLRISCADKRGESDDGPEPILHPPLNATAMTGDPRTDRPFLIAKLSTLTVLNGTTISSAERWDAELYYLHFINNLGLPDAGELWGRYNDLVKLHGSAEKNAPKQTTLKSKLVTLNVIPPSGQTFTLRILPTAPVSLLNKKVARQLKVNRANVWTARSHEAVIALYEPVEEMEEAREVGMYAGEGDYVVVVL